VETIVWQNRRAFEFSAELWAGLDQLLADRDAFPVLQKFLIKVSPKVTFNPRLHMPMCEALEILSGEHEIL
jgi:hypothetical protein